VATRGPGGRNPQVLDGTAVGRKRGGQIVEQLSQSGHSARGWRPSSGSPDPRHPTQPRRERRRVRGFEEEEQATLARVAWRTARRLPGPRCCWPPAKHVAPQALARSTPDETGHSTHRVA